LFDGAKDARLGVEDLSPLSFGAESTGGGRFNSGLHHEQVADEMTINGEIVICPPFTSSPPITNPHTREDVRAWTMNREVNDSSQPTKSIDRML
jgi:hypothetical protein